MSTTETPARLREQPGTPRHRRGARPVAIAAALAVTAALLWWGYYRLSWTVPATSDGAAIALQAHDMLHGNWLLSGWTVGDVSFWTTELPEYALVETVRHLGPGVIHTAAALTYTLLVVLAGFLARGRAHGREGLVRGVLAAGIMLAPQLGYGTFVLLLSPDHVGTEVPLLLGWLILDLAPRRWWVPVLLGLLLAWTQIGDRVTLLTAVVPLIFVCVVRACRPRSERWFELALAAAGVASVAVAAAAEKLLIQAGWFTVYPVNLTLAPVRLLWTHTWLTGWGILELFGANFIGVSGWPGVFFAIVHVAGLALAVAGFALALWRFLRLRADMDLVDSVLAVAIVCNLVSYVISTEPGTVLGTGYDAREIAAVLPLGAVLAGLPDRAAARAAGGATISFCLYRSWSAGLLRRGTWLRRGTGRGARRQRGPRRVAGRARPPLRARAGRVEHRHGRQRRAGAPGHRGRPGRAGAHAALPVGGVVV